MPLWADEDWGETRPPAEIAEREHKCIRAKSHPSMGSAKPSKGMCTLSGHHSWSVGTVTGAGYCGRRLLEYHYYCFTALMQWTTTYGDRNNITITTTIISLCSIRESFHSYVGVISFQPRCPCVLRTSTYSRLIQNKKKWYWLNQ